MQGIIAQINRKFFTAKKNVFEGFSSTVQYNCKNANPVFISGAGRSGTHFLATIFDQKDQFDSFHLDTIGNSIGDSFEIYTRWYQLPVSHYPFINSRGFLIQKALKENKRYLESNPLIAFSLAELYRNFGGTVIIAVRNPRKVIESHFKKGWYNDIDLTLNNIPGFSYKLSRPNHYFSRFTPEGPALSEWNGYSQLKKVVWMWVNTYERILKDISSVSKEDVKFIYLDQFDYNAYETLSKDIKCKEVISAKEFNKILNERPGKGKKADPVTWDPESKAYYNENIPPVLSRLLPGFNTDEIKF